MKKEFISTIIMSVTLGASNIIAAEISDTQAFLSDTQAEPTTKVEKKHKKKDRAAAVSTESIRSIDRDQSSSSTATKRRDPEVIRKKITQSISEYIFKIITETASDTNDIFRQRLQKVQRWAEAELPKKMAESGHSGRDEASAKKDFAGVWRDGVNYAYEYSVDSKSFNIAPDDLIQEESEETKEVSEEKGVTGPSIKKITTTLLNLLLRQKSCIEHAKKIQTFIEMGADVNLHKNFYQSIDMENQPEYPLQIVLFETDNLKEKIEMLSVFFKDREYSLNHFLDDKSQNKKVIESLLADNQRNKDYVLRRLLDKSEFTTFAHVMTYLEFSGVYILNDNYTDNVDKEPQIRCPILEDILERMMEIRRSAKTHDENGTYYDNIDEFFKTMNGHLSKNHESRFSAEFQNKIKTDFKVTLDRMGKRINDSRTETEMEGELFPEKLIEWSKLANFRNRILRHFNIYALTGSNEKERSATNKLVRYANIGMQQDHADNLQEKFNELRACQGKDIIFKIPNRNGWTPPMYSVLKKSYDKVTLLIKQTNHNITEVDGVGNNILHLAFPLPEQFYKAESTDNPGSALDMIGVDFGEKGMCAATQRVIEAIITEPTIPDSDKIKALKQKSAANFTPVSLAAATGYVDVYKTLVNWLSERGQFDEVEHEFLAQPLSELYQVGLNRHLTLLSSDTDVSEKEKIQKAIEEQKERLKNRKVITLTYLPSLSDAQEIYESITKKAFEGIEAAKNAAGSRLGTGNYHADALNKIISEMQKPSKQLVQVGETIKKNKIVTKEKVRRKKQHVEPSLREKLDQERANKKNKSIISRAKSALGLSKKKEPAFREIMPQSTEPEYDIVEKTIDDPNSSNWKRIPIMEEKLSSHEGIQNATTSVKVSYLRPAIQTLLDAYLKEHTSQQEMPMKEVYKALTGWETLDYFARNFNNTVEKKMQDMIVEYLKAAGKTGVEEETKNKVQNRFDDVVKKPSTVVFLDSSSDEESSDDESEKGEDLEF